MPFQRIQKENWSRREYFDHYFSAAPCTYSMAVKLDITQNRKKRQKIYPTMLYSLTTIVNRHPEFRTALNDKGELGIYSEMIPCYTVFHKDTQTFSNLWTEYVPDYGEFCALYEKDLEEYGNREGMIGKPDIPENTFPVSAIPWVSFEGFHLNLQRGYHYLTPIFTIGKCYEEAGKNMLPLAIQVHHAVCDGYHVAGFVNELQEFLHEA
ncbi:MAG TPA: type A chloramphenicol O-acetyltransferase [Candidatus Pullichristensenella excrementigallinarum]|uniref:Chloramphenicol acetyltransferase n=1 Tax=Candidatus Pullichristensenella excrementigallinarum TaxID=2840907 RepID=A0A9D1LBX6_9FIRM|nr:type A chloramphenicol O-acetyltransferase [Candidatus Pullichristensenella excrementigallinarum]